MPPTTNLSSWAAAAAAIRAAYKALGWTARDVSVRTRSYAGGGSSIHVTVKSPDVDLRKAWQIAQGQERVRYDEHSGEILSGGNRFVFVEHGAEARAALAQRLLPALQKAAEELKDEPPGRFKRIEERLLFGKPLEHWLGWAVEVDSAHDHRMLHAVHRDLEHLAYAAERYLRWGDVR
jgi:hypothetical protein